MNIRHVAIMSVWAAIALATPAALGQYEITWHTIDGGGAMYSTDGMPDGFVLSGTIGQPDAGPAGGAMTGESLELRGGFWVVAPDASQCGCMGDMNHDGLRDGDDIAGFVTCLFLGGDCGCAEFDRVSGVTAADVALFVAALVSNSSCP